MNRQYFGTDGIRGPYGGPVINEAFAARLGAAAGRWLKHARPGEPGADNPTVLIGRDPRFSGEALARALAAGFAAEGWRPRALGVLPTPAAAQAVRLTGAALGAMVTASHNPAADNGIKFFNGNGRKLSDEEEAAIEGLLPDGNVAAAGGSHWPQPGESLVDALADYVAEVCGLLPAGSLRGWRIVLDTANGAAWKTSPLVLRQLGADVVGLGDAPDGRNINDGVGSEHPDGMRTQVRATRARLGVAHDGDGDRCVLCDEQGVLLCGDEILTLLATHALAHGRLAAKTLVVTVHSNLGVDAAIAAAGGRVLRAAVGDRHVVEQMAASGATLGGESSGHFIFSDVSATGDGLVAALKVIEVMLATGRPLSELRRVLRKYPQASSAVIVRQKKPLGELKTLTAAIQEVENQLGSRGRVLVRYSGTEPKLRLLVEGPEDGLVQAGLGRLEAAAAADLG